ncbi:uncharacterized protein LOC122255139 [Penaeus japonicus]|uniref:uncharacterized protein LOC122255139 n=1 Tax=Penaeus japonicus TaxID=27405 RepID=UPI001C70CACF|nr:uncharacterized protein LOC122255139 [Penaeus japonicus]
MDSWKQIAFLFASIKVSCGVVFFPGNRPGAIPGGGALPSTGGSFPSSGGSFPSAGGIIPSAGGSFPSAGFLFPPLGGNLPISGGNIQGQTFLVPCGSQLEVFPGVSYSIRSPGYPFAAPPWTLCRWYFYTRDVSRRVAITCQDFSMPSATDCRSGPFLATGSGNNAYQWFCGESGLVNVVLTSNTLEAIFWSSAVASPPQRGSAARITHLCLPLALAIRKLSTKVPLQKRLVIVIRGLKLIEKNSCKDSGNNNRYKSML